ncbi:MAG TPA: protein phosphatase 2C domain-containing protein [Candidatus Wunengus sp. YC63]|uniref:protein phosphatase 2C domain-containing protein n=1 Tax=Candidatus Wunengus sp. YC63 TaxID=3367699 RepID=UPI004024EB5E
MIKIINKSVKGGQKAKNDDRVFCKTYNDPSPVNKLNLVAIAAVADGVGGVKGGDKASAIAVKEFESRVERHRSFESLKDIDEFFKNTYKEINQIVLKEQENQNFPDMCTTLVSAGLFRTAETEQYYLFVVNCGDSPLLCIDTDRDEIELLSTIHHTGSHLTQYLGKQNLEIHNSYCQCPKNGFILLSSDGLTGNMSNSPLVSREEIKKYLVETKSIDEASEILIRLAQYKGSSDDISVAILEIGKPKRVKPKLLTPIVSERHRIIGERLLYAACIIMSIFGVFHFKSRYSIEKDKYEKLYKEYNVLNKENEYSKTKCSHLETELAEIKGRSNIWEIEDRGKETKIQDMTRQMKKYEKELSRLNEQKKLLADKGYITTNSKQKTESNTKKDEDKGTIKSGTTGVEQKSDVRAENGTSASKQVVTVTATGTVPNSNTATSPPQSSGSETDKIDTPVRGDKTSEDEYEAIKIEVRVSSKGQPIEDAEIYLEHGNEWCPCGRTDKKGMLDIPKKNNFHKIKAHKDGFEVWEKVINLSIQSTPIEIELNTPSELSSEGSGNPEECKKIKFDLTVMENKKKSKKPISDVIINLDNEGIGTTDGNGKLVKQKNVKIGKHTLTMKRNGYKTIASEIDISGDFKDEIVLEQEKP